MNLFFHKLCHSASKLIHSDEYKNRNVTVKNAFTRNRKLSFHVIITLILNMLSRTMQIEIDDFFSRVLKTETDSVTKQAFFKARKNVSHTAFNELFNLTRDMIFTEAALNKSNARVSMLFDVVSGFVIDAIIGSIDIDERTYAMDNLQYFSEICNNKDIVIFDRGYPSKSMIAFMSALKCKYLMRIQRNSFNAIRNNPSTDFWITVNYEKQDFSVRVIRVQLESGETETLITNLSENEFKAADFKNLYFKRWGVEKAYDDLKNKLLIEKFSGRTPLAVLQEFYAAMFILNCVSAISLTTNNKISKWSVIL